MYGKYAASLNVDKHNYHPVHGAPIKFRILLYTHRNNTLGAARTSAGTSLDTGRADLQSCHEIQDSVGCWDTWSRSAYY